LTVKEKKPKKIKFLIKMLPSMNIKLNSFPNRKKQYSNTSSI